MIKNNENEQKILKHLIKEFSKISKLKYFLEIEVVRYKCKIFISQQKYIYDLLKNIGILEYKPTTTLNNLHKKNMNSKKCIKN